MRIIKTRFTRGRVAALTATLLFAGSASAITATMTNASASTSQNMYVTLYGWPDNSPPGDGTAFGSGHAGGTGTYSDPVTFATDQDELAPGTRVYYPYLHRYFIMQDECVECDQDWANGKWHIDLWIGGEGGNTTDVINCEDALTQDSAQVIINPSSSEPVDTTPLFDSNTDSCYDPSSFSGGGGGGGGGSFPAGDHQLVVDNDALCVDVSGGSTTNGAAIIQWTCKSSGNANQEWAFNPVSGGYGELQNLNSGKDLVVQSASTSSGAKIIQYTQNGTTNGLWLPIQLSDGSWQFKNEHSALCLDVTGASSSTGVQLEQWGCKSSAAGTNQGFAAQ